MGRYRQIVLSVAFLLGLASVAVGQYFGKNKVQYTYFHWQYIQTRHFDIYYTDGGKKLAEYVAQKAEEGYEHLSQDFRYELLDRITIIVYRSHNDFEQTNVDLSPPEESVGGFTEFFKNRVVIPYEGQWEQFRHVIQHELTHAVQMQMMYGTGVMSIVMGMTRLQLPLWFVEGIAEYESLGWDTDSDMFMRDATLNGYVPPIPYLNAFMAYKGGQSVWYYIAQRYGQEKIGEIQGKVKISRNVENGFRRAIGLSIEELSERWHKYLKKRYWPDIAGRDEPEDVAKKLTDHKKDGSFVNLSPVMNPRGDKVAFMSDKSGYFDVYLVSTIDGKLLGKVVSGQRSGSLEELHWLKGRNLSWSPDGKFLILSAKAGPKDELHVVDVAKKKIVNSYTFDLDGVYNPTWSPKGDKVVFSGMVKGQSDLYLLDLQSRKLTKLTDDVFSDIEPAWSPDGQWIAFASDRGRYLSGVPLPKGFDIAKHDTKNYDIYMIRANGDSMRRVVEGRFVERAPEFSPDGKKLAFTSDRSGISNIYLKDLSTGKEWAITNMLTSAFQPSWNGDGSRLVFTSFYNGGYDLYMLQNPLDIKPKEIPPTVFRKQREKEYKEELARRRKKREEEERLLRKRRADLYRHYVFDEDFKEGIVHKPEEATREVFLDSTEFKLPTGEYRVHNYKVTFSPDIVYGEASYSQFFGVQGQSLLAVSDVLGNHRINIYTNLFYDYRNSNYQLTYFYLPRRVDLGVGAYHYALFFLNRYNMLLRDRNYGANLYTSYPFNRYERADFGLSLMAIDREWLEYSELPTIKRRAYTAELSLVRDTSIWGFTGPVSGVRAYAGVSVSPGFGKNGVSFLTFREDYRKYFRIHQDYTFAFRLASGASFGDDPQRFFLGGMDNWINLHFRGGLRVDDPEDIYFASFVTPMRGGWYYEREGTRFFLANLEFRFPAIRYLVFGWPLPMGFQNIRGVLFSDIGGAWSKYEGFKVFRDRPERGWVQLQDVFMSYGFGLRANMGFFVLMFDVAWPTDLVRSRNARYYFSLGTDW